MTEIDQYIMRFSPEIQRRLLTIRQIGCSIFLGADEKLYHTLPAFSKNGKIIIFYGAYKNHISICVGYDWVDFLKTQYPQFSYTKATILFPHMDSFPEDVVEMICKLAGTQMAQL